MTNNNQNHPPRSSNFVNAKEVESATIDCSSIRRRVKYQSTHDDDDNFNRIGRSRIVWLSVLTFLMSQSSEAFASQRRSMFFGKRLFYRYRGGSQKQHETAGSSLSTSVSSDEDDMGIRSYSPPRHNGLKDLKCVMQQLPPTTVNGYMRSDDDEDNCRRNGFAEFSSNTGPLLNGKKIRSENNQKSFSFSSTSSYPNIKKFSGIANGSSQVPPEAGGKNTFYNHYNGKHTFSNNNHRVTPVEFVAETKLPTDIGQFQLRAYRVPGAPIGQEPCVIYYRDRPPFASPASSSLPVRIHDQCLTSEVFGSRRCDCKEQLNMSLKYIKKHGGFIIYLQQEGRGIGLANKIAAYSLQDYGLDTVDANLHLGFPDDAREYSVVPSILRDMQISSISLMTNNPRKTKLLTELGVVVDRTLPMVIPETNRYNHKYMETKVSRMDHKNMKQLFVQDFNNNNKNNNNNNNDFDDDNNEENDTDNEHTASKSELLLGGGAVRGVEDIGTRSRSTDKMFLSSSPGLSAEQQAIANGMMAPRRLSGMNYSGSRWGSNDTDSSPFLPPPTDPTVNNNRIEQVTAMPANAVHVSLEVLSDTEIDDDLTNQIGIKAREDGYCLGKQSVIDAIESVKRGEMIVVVDDLDRENEGDFIMAADMCTDLDMARIIRYSSGVVCIGMEGKRMDELHLPAMVTNNEDPKGTAFSVSVDASKEHGVTTGISARDRATTMRLLANPNSQPSDFHRPGHIFPLRAVEGGVLARGGHTEASVDFARLAGRSPAGVLCEIVSEENPTEMMRLPEIKRFCKKYGYVLTSIADLAQFRRETEIKSSQLQSGLDDSQQ